MRRVRTVVLAVTAALIVGVGVYLAIPASPPEPATPDVLQASGVQAGLAVHLGSTDGRLEISLARSGRMLVQGLALDGRDQDLARAAIQEQGLYGLASVETLTDTQRLPYADNLVNLLVADLDALGGKAPPREEILRVVCPNGVAYLKQEGRWNRTVKPRPAEMDEWTHFDYGPEGNGVSHDRLVRQPHCVQWISGVQPIPLDGNPAGFVNLTGMRVAGGRAVFDYTDEGRRPHSSQLTCRDAFSGVPLWTLPRPLDVGLHRWQLVAVGDRVYTGLTHNGPLTALDAATGKVALKFDEAAPITNRTREGTQVRVCAGVVLLNIDDVLYALDAHTGKRLWQYRDTTGGALLFPAASATEHKVFVAVGPEDAKPWARWPWSIVRAIVCLDLASGEVVWRNTEVDGKPVGQLIYDHGLLGLFAGCAIGGRDAKDGGWVSSITVADGKLHGDGKFRSAWNDSMYNAVIRNGQIYYAGHTTLYRFDPTAATINKEFSTSYNQRCNRFCATDDLFLMGYVTYLDRDCNGTLQSVARAGCALGATPANGMLYFTPNACHCFTMLRGYLALSPEPVREPLPDAERLQQGKGQTPPPLPARVAAPSGPLAEDWLRQPDRATTAETAPVPLGEGLSLVAVIHQHRVEARDANGGVKWAFTAGGRVSQAPLVHEGRVYFGSHDGWVYALKAADGTLLWRYLAAPYERQMMAYGQLESSWPVYGVLLHQGLIWASAGLHPEIGGGVYVVGLDPVTGAAKHRRVLAKSVARLTTQSGKTTGTIVPESFLNDVLQADGDLLCLGEFSFDPTTSDDELKARLDTPPVKKKK